jgi:hypothetical protein
MSTYKRRIVYLSDEEWEQLGRIAKGLKQTISATVRDLLFVPLPSEHKPIVSVTSQARRDELLRKINRSK